MSTFKAIAEAGIECAKSCYNKDTLFAMAEQLAKEIVREYPEAGNEYNVMQAIAGVAMSYESAGVSRP